MNLLMIFCGYMALVYVPWDFFFKPVATDEEVWFGVLLTGWAAKITEPLHWLIYAGGAIGFWRMRHWMHPWALLYVLQIAIGMLVWNLTDARGGGLSAGLVSMTPFLILAVMLWRARALFNTRATPAREEEQEEQQT